MIEWWVSVEHIQNPHINSLLSLFLSILKTILSSHALKISIWLHECEYMSCWGKGMIMKKCAVILQNNEKWFYFSVRVSFSVFNAFCDFVLLLPSLQNISCHAQSQMGRPKGSFGNKYILGIWNANMLHLWPVLGNLPAHVFGSHF